MPEQTALGLHETRFNRERADRARDFITTYVTLKDGDKMVLSPWEADAVREVFGQEIYNEEYSEWIRRYRRAFIDIPRSNGKSTGAAAFGLAHLCTEDRGINIFCAASSEEQARIVYDLASEMARENPALAKRMRVFKTHMEYKCRNGRTNRMFVVTSGKAFTKLGRRPDIIIFDEILALQDPEFYTVMTSGQGHSKEPMLWMLTTSGEEGTLYWEIHENAEAVKSGELEDPYLYYVRFGAEKTDDWEDEATWIKCNPAIGTSTNLTWFRTEYIKAKTSLIERLKFKKFYLNMLNVSEEVWLDIEKWDKLCNPALKEEDYRKYPLFFGIDISKRHDLSCLLRVYQIRKDEEYAVFATFYLPKSGIEDKSRRDNVPYLPYAEEGWLELTNGTVVDQGYILNDLRRIGAAHESELEVGYDAWNSQLAVDLDDEGISAVDVKQGYYLSEALKTLEDLVTNEKVVHNGNPLLRSHVLNARVEIDNADRIRLVKQDTNKNSKKRIDGIAAFATALDREIRFEDDSEWDVDDLLIF